MAQRGSLMDAYGGYSPDIADYEFRNGSEGLVRGIKPKGLHGLLARLSEGSDTALSKIDADMAELEAARRSVPKPSFLPDIPSPSRLTAALMGMGAGIIPGLLGSAARVAKAPMDYMSGRDVDLRATDAALALPFAGPAARAVAPAFRLSPEVATMAGMGGAGFGLGHGIASEANADGAGGRVTMPDMPDLASFEKSYEAPRPKLRSIDEAAAAARLAYEASPAYKSLIKQSLAVRAGKEADRIEREARARYGDEQAAYDDSVKKWDTAKESAWANLNTDYGKRKEAFQNQGFWDRNPEIKPYAMGAAYALPALFGAGSAIQKGRAQARMLEDIRSPDLATAASAKAGAEKMLNPSYGSRAGSAVTTALAAGAPFELRSIGDAIDATFAPEGSGAQKRAREHFENPAKYIAEGMPQMLSGAMLYGMGNKAGSLMTRDAKAGLMGAIAPNQAANIEAIAANRVAAARAQGQIDTSQIRADALRDATGINAGRRVDAMRNGAAIQGEQNAGLLASAKADAEALPGLLARQRQSAFDAARTDAPAQMPAGASVAQSAAPPVPQAMAPTPPRPQPRPAPVQNQMPLPPSPNKQPRAWANVWSDPARSSVLDWVKTNPGLPIESLSAPMLRGMIIARLPPGAPPPSAALVRDRLSKLKDEIGRGTATTAKDLVGLLATDPRRYRFSIAGPAIGAGAMGYGLMSDQPDQ